MENLLSVKEAAALIGCTTSSLYLAVHENRIPSVRVLGKIGIRAENAETYREKMGTANGWQKRHEREGNEARRKNPTAQ